MTAEEYDEAVAAYERRMWRPDQWHVDAAERRRLEVEIARSLEAERIRRRREERRR